MSQPESQTESQAGPSLSVVIPAHDEAEVLPTTLRRLREALAGLGRDCEIVVVDNDSGDATAEVARAGGAKVVHEAHRQISRARNTGARQAAGDYLLFVDADTWPSATLVRQALDALDAGACGGGALVAFEQAPNGLYRHGIAMWNFMAARLRIAAGCFIFARRDAFEAIGGFDERLYAGDEVTLSRRLRRWGRKRGRDFLILRRPPVLTSARKAQWYGPGQHLLMLFVALIPLALRSRRLMWFWYRRPSSRTRP